MADEFATAVTFLEVRDEKYKAQLKADEAVTTKSASKMNASLSSVTIDAGKATAGVSALGGAAAVTGNQTVGAAAQIGTMLASLGPLGPLAIAAGAAVAGLSIAWKFFAADQEKANEAIERSNELLDEQRKALEAAEARLQTRLGVSEIEQIRQRITGLANIQAALATTSPRFAALQQEIELLTIRQKELDLLGRIDQREAQQGLRRAEAVSRAKLAFAEAERREKESVSREQFRLTLIERGLALKRQEGRTAFAQFKSDLAAAARAVLTDKLATLQGALAALNAAPAGTIGAISIAAFRGQTNIATPQLNTAQVEDKQRDTKRNSLLQQIKNVLDEIRNKAATGGLAP